MKVVFCIPTVTRPYKVCLDSLRASIPLLDAAGWEHGMVVEVGCPYISAARATLLRKALDAKADVIVFIDHDISWKPSDLLKLIETKGDVIAGLYRIKEAGGKFMGMIDDVDTRPVVREDGCIRATAVPAGFLKITRRTVNEFMKAYPELIFGERCTPFIDLFNHGAYNGAWWGEDYAFSRNWRAMGEEIWIVPDLDLTHHSADGASYHGNYHEFMLRQPGGSKELQPMTIDLPGMSAFKILFDNQGDLNYGFNK